MPSPPVAPATQTGALWAQFDQTREEMRWDILDSAHTSRALLRITACLGWLALAWLYTVSGWWWGLLLLTMTSLSLLHGRRKRVLALADTLGRWGAVIRWLMPYPRKPRLHPIGVLDFIGVMLLGLATGRALNIFHPERGASGLAAAEGLLAIVAMAPGGVNMSAHVSWALDGLTPQQRRVRALIPLASGLCVAGCLYPASFSGRGHAALVVLALLAGVTTAGACRFGQWLQHQQIKVIDERADALRSAVQDFDAEMVHELKNIARGLYSEDWLSQPQHLQDQARDLALALSATEKALRTGVEFPALGLREIVPGALGLERERFAGIVDIIADLEPQDLLQRDADLLRNAAGNLVSNAVKAGASRFSIGLTAVGQELGALLTLTATCNCRTALTPSDVPPGSSLMKLARKVGMINGRLRLLDAGPDGHAFVISWPSTGDCPRVRANRPTMLDRVPLECAVEETVDDPAA